jgi:hypothetical protein
LNASNTDPPPLECTLAGFAAGRALVEDLAELRRPPALPGAPPLPANFLRQSDEQTVITLAAVFEAIHKYGLAPADQPAPFHDWGILSAPRFLGRPLITSSLPRFQAEGAWGVSPHVVAHRSLHSVSGTISQALKVYGPNFGVGGGPGGEREGLIAAIVLLHDMKLPGVWLTMSRLDPETNCDVATGRPAPGTRARGLALALTPLGSHPGRPVLQLTLRGHSGAEGQRHAPCTLDVLEEVLAGLESRSQSEMVVPLGDRARLTLRRPGLPLPGPHPSFFAPGAVVALPVPQRSDQP